MIICLPVAVFLWKGIPNQVKFCTNIQRLNSEPHNIHHFRTGFCLENTAAGWNFAPQHAAGFSRGKIGLTGEFFMKHRCLSSYWAASTSKDDGSLDDNSHCEAARAENDSVLARALDLISKSNLPYRGLRYPDWSFSAVMILSLLCLP